MDTIDLREVKSDEEMREVLKKVVKPEKLDEVFEAVKLANLAIPMVQEALKTYCMGFAEPETKEMFKRTLQGAIQLIDNLQDAAAIMEATYVDVRALHEMHRARVSRREKGS